MLFRREDILTLSEVDEDPAKFLWRVHFQDRYAISSVLMLQHFNLSHDELKSGT